MLTDLLRLARPTQWLKNGVVLAPLVFAGEMYNTAKIEYAFLATLIFCLLSSAIYTLNDLVDAEADRQHPAKKNRPIASGRIGTGTAIAMFIVLLIGGLTGAWFLSSSFFIVAIIFLILNAGYSFLLKNVVIVDAMTVALSFVIRAIAGAEAIDVPWSAWMLINTLFLSLFLSFGKRRHEITLLEEGAAAHRSILSHYSPYLLDQCIGVTTASVVVMYMLYTFSEEVQDKLQTEYLYATIPFVVYGIFRYLYLIHKEEGGGNPTKVLITDRPILIAVLLWLLTAVMVLYWL